MRDPDGVEIGTHHAGDNGPCVDGEFSRVIL